MDLRHNLETERDIEPPTTVSSIEIRVDASGNAETTLGAAGLTALAPRTHAGACVWDNDGLSKLPLRPFGSCVRRLV